MHNEISEILNKYKHEIKEIEKLNLLVLSNIAIGVHLSRTYIHRLRVVLRNGTFKSKELEITFFKEQKPYIYGRLKFYVKLHKYLLQKPSGSIETKRNYIDSIISKLEYHKTKNLDFLRYYSQGDTHLDKYYFLRGNDSLTLISDTSHYYTDPEFSTSHDNVVAQIIAYQLLTSFYNSELESLRRKEASLNTEEENQMIVDKLSWTATKTDLVELIYALHSSRAILNGQVEIKKIASTCEKLFDLDLGNFYRTYIEIRERKMDRTRFINILKQSLEDRMREDDE